MLPTTANPRYTSRMQFVLAFLAIIILIIAHEFGHFIVARLCHMKVERFSIFFGRPIAQFQRAGTIFQIGTIPLGGFVQITGMNPLEQLDPNDPYIYPNRPVWQRVLTLVAGPGANYLTAAIIMFGLYSVAGVPVPSNQQEVAQVVSAAPAEKAGIRPGDLLLTINDSPVNLKNPAHEIIDRSTGKPVRVRLIRDGKPIEQIVQPERASDGHYRIGVQLLPVLDYQRQGLAMAAKESLLFPVEHSKNIAQSLFAMLRGKQKADVSGPIGIVHQLGTQMKRGLRDAIGLIAFMSVVLGFFNLIPFPALDGGRLLLLLLFYPYELIARRRVNQRFEAAIHMVGFVFLVGVMLFASVKDVRRWVGPSQNESPAAGASGSAPASSPPAKDTPPAIPAPR